MQTIPSISEYAYVHIHPDVQYFRYAQIHTYTGLAWSLDLYFALVNCMNQCVQFVCGYHEYLTD